MAKQITISQGDYGIIFSTQIIDQTKKPIIVGTDNIRFYVVTPTRQSIPVDNVTIIDEENGLVEFEIQQEHTQSIGEHEVYVEISSPLFEVTSVVAATYTIEPEHGGA